MGNSLKSRKSKVHKSCASTFDFRLGRLMTMKFVESVFKAYDLRGLMGSELTPELAHGVGAALADFLPTEGPVAIGRDMRPDSEELAANLRLGLVEQGREVWDIGLVTTDMIYFAVGKYNLAGGAMVTASHNPGQYNGIKLCREDAKPIGIESGLEDIKTAIQKDSYLIAGSPGAVVEKNIVEDWINHALSFVDADKWQPYRVAVDAGNGMAGVVIPRLEPKVPLKLVEMDFKLDGKFPNHPANPMEISNIKDVVAEIGKNKLDFGIAFDGDGDRAFLIDENGEELSGSVMTAILAERELQKYPGATILYNAVCGRIVPETIAAHQGRGIRTKVGHSYIKEDMRRFGAAFAGEHSGHFYFKNNYNADSGLIAALVAIDALNESGLKLSEFAAKYRKYAESGEINTKVAHAWKKMEELGAKYQDGQHDELDGLTVEYSDWRFSVRPSNTESVLRLNVEANNKELMIKKRDEILAIVRL